MPITLEQILHKFLLFKFSEILGELEIEECNFVIDHIDRRLVEIKVTEIDR